MNRIYSEKDLTWSSVEKDYQYDKVVWSIMENGIPVYTLIDEKNKRIKVL